MWKVRASRSREQTVNNYYLYLDYFHRSAALGVTTKGAQRKLNQILGLVFLMQPFGHGAFQKTTND